MTLGQKIKEVRLSRSMTQRELVGDAITRNMLSKIENDSATPSMRTLEYLAKALGVPASYFLSDAPLSDGSVPDGLDGARDAYRGGDWDGCLAFLKADPTAATTDEGYLLQALAGARAARSALDRGDAAAAREYAEEAHYYNAQGMYRSSQLEGELALLLSDALGALGEASLAERRSLLESALELLKTETR